MKSVHAPRLDEWLTTHHLSIVSFTGMNVEAALRVAKLDDKSIAGLGVDHQARCSVVRCQLIERLRAVRGENDRDRDAPGDEQDNTGDGDDDGGDDDSGPPPTYDRRGKKKSKKVKAEDDEEDDGESADESDTVDNDTNPKPNSERVQALAAQIINAGKKRRGEQSAPAKAGAFIDRHGNTIQPRTKAEVTAYAIIAAGRARRGELKG